MGTVKYNEKRKYWEVRYDAARHGDGERNQKYKGGFTRKRDAEAFLAEQETNINRGVYIDPQKTFVFEYLIGWLEDKKDTISPTTYSGYEINIRCHINPYVGGLRLQELKPPHIRNLYQQLKKDRKIKIGGKVRQFKKLSNTSIQYIHRVLSK
ncbi:MAG: Arm DNA-binding domain-containing protein, partial [Bacteroidales bacterium]|nr:Arm DNA-binding domain-containing protein [Bacteroidales bacterium]